MTLKYNPEKFEKRNTPYEGEVLVQTMNEVMGVQTYALGRKIYNQEETLRKVGVTMQKEKGIEIEKGREQLVSTILVKALFDDIEEVKRKEGNKRINIVVYNPGMEMQTIVETLKKDIDYIDEQEKALRDELENRKKGRKFKEGSTSGIITDYIATTNHYQEFMKKKIIERDENVAVEAVMYAAIKLSQEGLNLKDLKEKINMIYFRYEVDYEKEDIKIYRGVAPIASVSRKKFEPWHYGCKEELLEQFTFMDVKKQYVKEGFLKGEDVLKEVVESVTEDTDDKEIKVKEELKESDGCPERQYSEIGYEYLKVTVNKDILTIATEIIHQELLKKKVEKSVVMKKRNGKMKPVTVKTVYNEIDDKKAKKNALNMV